MCNKLLLANLLTYLPYL